LATYQQLVTSLTTEVQEAREAYDDAYGDADLEESTWEELYELEYELYEVEYEVQELTWLFEDIEAELAWEAEVARQKKMEEQKRNALKDAKNANEMYGDFISMIESRLEEIYTIRPSREFTTDDIVDAINRNQAALDEA
jgi:organic radical activating enzyme